MLIKDPGRSGERREKERRVDAGKKEVAAGWGGMSLRKKMGSNTQVEGSALDECGQLFYPGLTGEKAEGRVMCIDAGSCTCGNFWKLSF